MSKEAGQSFIPSANEHGPMRVGKTERDRRSGAHDRLLNNRAAEAEENRKGAGTAGKARKK